MRATLAQPILTPGYCAARALIDTSDFRSIDCQEPKAECPVDIFEGLYMQMPLDPDVADTAPTDPALTPYDHEHLATYLRLLDADAEVPTGVKSPASSCISIPPASPIAPDGRSIAT